MTHVKLEYSQPEPSMVLYERELRTLRTIYRGLQKRGYRGEQEGVSQLKVASFLCVLMSVAPPTFEETGFIPTPNSELHRELEVDEQYDERDERQPVVLSPQRRSMNSGNFMYEGANESAVNYDFNTTRMTKDEAYEEPQYG